MLTKLKSWFSEKFKEKEEVEGIPSKRIDIVWKDETNLMGLEGDSAKVVVLPHDERELPHSEHYVKAYQEVHKAPIFDRTGGKDTPGVKIWKEVNPAKLEWED